MEETFESSIEKRDDISIVMLARLVPLHWSSPLQLHSNVILKLRWQYCCMSELSHCIMSVKPEDVGPHNKSRERSCLGSTKKMVLLVNRAFVPCPKDGVLTKMAKTTNLHSNQ